MPTPGFEIAADVHGRDVGGLGASGGKLVIDVSAVSAGGFIPGNHDEIAEGLWMIRIAATVDVWINFSFGADTADDTNLLFQAGTEMQKLPQGSNYVSAITVDAAATGKVQIALML